MSATAELIRGRGRPRGHNSRQRSRLLQAASELLKHPLHPELTLRQVAVMAGVTPALANYYFANRQGLLTALLRESLEPRIDQLAAATRQRETQGPAVAVTTLIQRLTALLASDPALAHVIVLPFASPLRERLRSLLCELLEQAQARQILRADLTPAYLADALLGLCLSPFLDAQPGVEEPATRAATLTLQHIALLQAGIVANQSPRQDSAS